MCELNVGPFSFGMWSAFGDSIHFHVNIDLPTGMYQYTQNNDGYGNVERSTTLIDRNGS